MSSRLFIGRVYAHVTSVETVRYKTKTSCRNNGHMGWIFLGKIVHWIFTGTLSFSQICLFEQLTDGDRTFLFSIKY